MRALLSSGVPPDANAFKAIGYREVLKAILAGLDPAGCVEEVKIHTRQFSKRQRTWFKKEPWMIVLNAAEPLQKNAERVAREWRRST